MDLHCRFGMSDALMLASRTVRAVHELGQLEFCWSHKRTEEEERQDTERWQLVVIAGPADWD